MKTPDSTLIAALEVLVRDIQSDDGVANACIAEVARRLQELADRNAELTQALEFVAKHCAIRKTSISGVCDVSVASMSLAISMENEFRHAPPDVTPFDLILKAAKANVCKEPTK
jgi:hypothetical protein